MLIERGADVSAQDKNGRTPVHLALQAGRRKVARVLIEHGASVPAQNKDGTSPHMAVLDNSDPIFGTFDYSEVARTFTERVADGPAQKRTRAGRRGGRKEDEEEEEEEDDRTRTRMRT